MVTQGDVDYILKLRERLENEYAKSGDERLVMVVSYVAAAQAAMRLLLRRNGAKEAQHTDSRGVLEDEGSNDQPAA